MRPIIILSLITLLLYFTFALQRPFIPLFMEEVLDASVLEVGYAASALGLTGIIIAVPAGILSDRFGRKILIVFSSVLWTFSILLIAISSDPIQVVIGYAISGISIVMFDAALSAYVGDISNTNTLSKGYASYNTAIQIGFTLGPMIGGVLLLQTTYRNTFLIISFVPIIVALIITKKSIKNSYKAKKQFEKLTIRIKKILGNKSLLKGWAAIFCISFLISGVSVLIPLYSRIIGFSELFIGLLFSFQSLAGAFGLYPFRRIIYKSNKLTYLTSFGLLVMILSTFGFAVNTSEIGFILLMCFFGLGLSLSFIVSSVIIARDTDISNRGLAMGFGSMFRFGGFMIGPWVGSIVVASQENINLGYSYGFIYLAVFSILIIPIIIFSNR